MDQIKIGKFIQEKRKEKRLTQSELAEKINVSDRAVSKWENGNCIPDVSNIQELCKILNIKSKAKHYKYKKPGAPFKIFPNLLMSEIQIDGPLQCIVSDMTAFWVKGIYYELTLYMDLWNNEILSRSLSSKRGDRMTYISGLENLLEIKI